MADPPLEALALLEAVLLAAAPCVVCVTVTLWVAPECVAEEPFETVVEVTVTLGSDPVAEAPAAGAVDASLAAWADFSSSAFAFCCDVSTAPWALAIARVRPSTPGADPWYTAFGAPVALSLVEAEDAGVVDADLPLCAGADGAEEPEPEVLAEWPCNTKNHTAANRPIASRAI